MEYKGYVAHIIFRNDENGYTVFELEIPDGDEITCVGNFPFISEGEFVCVSGEMTHHHIYNEQLKVASFEVTDPDNEVAILRYLSSGIIKGIRGGLAKRIVDRFGDRTFEVMEKRPEELIAIKGISEKKAFEIAENFSEQREMRRAVIFLQKYGISGAMAIKIYKFYADSMYDVLRTNPYRLAEDIDGVGFKKADEIARKAGFAPDSPGRVRAGLLYILGSASGEGHTYLPMDVLISSAMSGLSVDSELILDVLSVMSADNVIKVSDEKGEKRIYLPMLYYAELNCARMLVDLDIELSEDKAEDEQLKKIEKRNNIVLDDIQREAVKKAMQRGVTIITGGPGTGKTTTINTLIGLLKSENYSILLAAPTGRAAKRMEEACGYPSQTIHRLLEYSGSIADGEMNTAGGRFGRNRETPLEADVVIVDEMSMVDIFLFQNLLNAITIPTRLIMVGDENQLPSVGPGNVLKDIIASERFNVVKLNKVFRQARESDIVMNAHRILAGEQIELINRKDGDFFFDPRETAIDTLELMKKNIGRMSRYYGLDPFDIQILCPMKKGDVGVNRCNEVLQGFLNPPSPDKNEIRAHDFTFREGDKVMQVKNNYKMEYVIYGYNHIVIEEGTGVFNGDIGRIVSIDTASKLVEIVFDNERHVNYGQGDLLDLEPAYAVTVHKSQGSEYPVVLMPLLGGPGALMTRNILYTALTRGVKCVMIIGREQVIRNMIDNESVIRRYCALSERINMVGK